MKRLITLLVLLLGLFVAWRTAHTQAAPFATTIRVPTDQPTIKAAVNAAQPGDTVELAPGTYKGADNREITVNKAITIRCRTGNAASCIVDAEQAGKAVFYFRTANLTPVLEGITVKNGFGFFYEAGGIVISNGARPLIRDCIITSNIAVNSNGGVSVENASPEFRNCVITKNLGHGMKVTGSSVVTISGCTFSENFDRAGLRIGGESSGVINEAPGKPSASVSDCRFENNGGPGLDLSTTLVDSQPSAVVIGSVFTGNGNSGVQAFGADTLSLTNCALLFNTGIAPSTGGLHASFTFKVALTNSLIVGNRVVARVAQPGVIDSPASAATLQIVRAASVTNCTFTAHAISTLPTLLVLPAPDRGLVNVPFPVTNTILWGNTSTKDILSGTAPGFPVVTVSNCDTQNGIEGIADGGGNLSQDPLFVRNALTNNASDAGDLRLQNASPVKDRGTLAALDLSAFAKDVSGNPLDYALAPRLSCDYLIDMGAYENQILSGSIFAVGTPTTTGTLATNYASSVAANPAAPTGFSYRYSLANGTTLPSGLSLNAGTGAITGAPSVGGNASFAIKVELLNPSNAVTGCSNTQTRSINVTCPSFTVGTLTGTGTVGTNYSSSPVASPPAPNGFSYRYSLANNTTLPSGLSLNAGTGAITGVPNVSGTFSFDIKAELFNTNNVATGCSDTQTRSLNIACPTFTVGNPNNGALGTPYNSSIAATPAAPGGFSYRYTLANNTTLPPGVTLDANSGALTGTPTTLGNFSFDLKAELFNANNVTAGCSVTQARSINIGCPTFTVGTPTTSGTLNTPYNSSAAASPAAPSGYKYQYSLANNTALPRGLTLDAATGALSGTPTVSGSFSFDLKAELLTTGNATTGCSDTKTRSITLSCPSFTVGTPTNTGALGVSYNSSAAASPAAPSGYKFQYSLVNGSVLPGGLTLDAATGAISGTPTVSGSFSFDLKAELLTSGNAATGCSDTKTRNITIACVSNPVVQNLNDSGAGSLREAIARACPGSTITFAQGLSGTLTLTSGDLMIDKSLSIEGPGAQTLTLSGNQQWRIFTTLYQRGVLHDSTIAGLNLINGNGKGARASADGGAIYHSNEGTLTLREVSISGCTANLGGAIALEDVSNPSHTLNLIRSTLSGNSATSSGGGLDTRSPGVVNVINSTIANNRASFGGGLGNSVNSSAKFNLVESTITGNQGGGLMLLSFSGRGNFGNSLIALNSGGDIVTFNGAPIVSTGYNLFGSVPAGVAQPTDLVGVNPLLELDGNGKPLLAFNGGPTQTIRLLPGSPALDAGAAATDPSTNQPLTTDQRGQARPYDLPNVVNANGGNGSDIGAYEHNCATLTLGTLPNGTAGAAYSQAPNPSGGFAPYTLALASGTLPPGLSLSGGSLTGVPTLAGTYSFTLSVADGYGCTGSRSYTLSLACPTISLYQTVLPNATVNTAYPITLTASPAGGNYSFTVTSGLLPTGLTLNSDGSFSGAPTQSGTFNFRVTATGFGTCSTFRDYTLLVNCAVSTLNPASLPGGTLGTTYNQQVSASPAGTYSYTVTSGTLPGGLTLNAATGAITGTPTASGTFSFTITAAAGGGCTTSRSYTVTIGCASVSFTTTGLPGAQAGTAYNQTLGVSPAGSYSFSLLTGGLPAGLTLNTATGQISGTATTPGNYSFTIQALNANGCGATQPLALAVTCPAITVNPATLPNGTTGTAYSQSLTATPAGNYSFSKTSGTLPPGLSLSSNGSLSGTPTTAGTYTFAVAATAFGTCSGSQSYTLTISTSCAAIMLPALPTTGTVNVNYTGNLAATTPSASYTFSVASGTLPLGLAIDNLFGQLRGKPTTPGTYTFTLKATRSNGCSGTREYTVVIGGSSMTALARTADYDGDGKSDLSLWSNSNGRWQILRSSDEQTTQTTWGGAGDVSLLGDYDGDGQSDLAVFRPANGTWYVKQSSDGSALVKAWGAATDVPVPGDYDGDGQTDLAVFRPAEGNWYVLQSSDGGYLVKAWGLGVAPYLDVPVPGDYDGDGQTDLAVFRRQTGTWLIQRSSDGQFTAQAWGGAHDIPVVGDYDGDGKADLAVWRGATGQWLVLRSSDQGYDVQVWGAASVGDVPAPGDYDGDGQTDLAVWRAPEATWYIQCTADGTVRTRAQGGAAGWQVTGRLR